MSNTILKTSITILALTFSLTFLSIQIAAQTYSPRLLDDFIKGPVSKISIAVDLGAFAYSYTMPFYLYRQSATSSTRGCLLSLGTSDCCGGHVCGVHSSLCE